MLHLRPFWPFMLHFKWNVTFYMKCHTSYDMSNITWLVKCNKTLYMSSITWHVIHHIICHTSNDTALLSRDRLFHNRNFRHSIMALLFLPPPTIYNGGPILLLWKECPCFTAWTISCLFAFFKYWSCPLML